MAEDQVVSDVIKGDDQPDDKQSGEAEEKPSIEKLAELTKGLQKGYTINRQEISEIKDNLETIAQTINKQTGAVSGEEEYLTVGKLKEILSSQAQEQEQRKAQADKYIDDSLATLRAEGKLSAKEEEEELINFALEIKEPDLFKAATIFEKVKSARKEGLKETAKTKARQEEGSKIGTSSKTSEGESRGIDYDKVRSGNWWG